MIKMAISSGALLYDSRPSLVARVVSKCYNTTYIQYTIYSSTEYTTQIELGTLRYKGQIKGARATRLDATRRDVPRLGKSATLKKGNICQMKFTRAERESKLTTTPGRAGPPGVAVAANSSSSSQRKNAKSQDLIEKERRGEERRGESS